jgi:ubiquinone/menaquinone biosynthesis C-methylase UbiE
MGSTTTGFEGTSGRLAGAVMARLNRDMEEAAVLELDPAPGSRVLAVGFGPGIGVAALASKLRGGLVAGIDPSSVMVDQASRRNRAALNAGRVQLVAAGADAIPWPDGSFDAAVAVNSMQLWDPFEASLHEVGRVLGAGATLVTVTHCWAVEKRAPLGAWVDTTTDALHTYGFDGVTHRTAKFRSGEGLVLRANRVRPAHRPTA